MAQTITVFGYGAAGKLIAEALQRRGDEVRVAQRTRPRDFAAGLAFQACDVMDADAVRQAAEGADQIVFAIGLPYTGKVWKADWPRAMRHLLNAAAETNARVVFIDNLYMYGAQTAPLKEDMPLTKRGVKPAARAEVTRMWQAEAAAGRVTIAALRPSDFYGPGGENAQLGDFAIGALARGKAAQLLMRPDLPHDFAYLPDVARAAVTLLEAPDDVFGQAWHVPCAPVRTPRELLEMAAKALGVRCRISALPLGLLPVMGALSPMMREMQEMQFQFGQAYRVDSSKFARRFWSDATPFEVGIPATAAAFRAALVAA